MAVLNRPPMSGEDRLFFVCRTYQRFPKAGVCSCHSIKEQVVTEAVLAKVKEVCEAYLDPKKLQPIAADAVEKARQAESHEAEIQFLHSKIDSLTVNLDKMYMDRLTGLLAEADFERIYQRVKMERSSLEEKLKELEAQKENPVSTEERARELVQQFLDSAYTSRELLVSLIERVELTEDKQIIIKFRFRELEAISYRNVAICARLHVTLGLTVKPSQHLLSHRSLQSTPLRCCRTRQPPRLRMDCPFFLLLLSERTRETLQPVHADSLFRD